MYGHRRNPEGYARALQDADARIHEFLDVMNENDVLIFTSDHGNDPTWRGTDHTREYGMLLAYRPNKKGIDLGTRQSFADIGATVAKLLEVSWAGKGESFLS